MKWPDVLDTETLRRTCFNTFIFIDAIGGTGGGIFRYMYGRYLDEAAGITGISELRKSRKELTAIGDHWQEWLKFLNMLLSWVIQPFYYQKTTEPIMSIADMEQNVWERLRAIVG